MPNWVNNRVQFACDQETFEKIAEAVKSDERVFDFEKIIPMPDYIYRGNLGRAEEIKYGTNNWYDWSIQNWGTKWNASNSDLVDLFDDRHEFEFDTAWSDPEPVLLKLSEMFPDVIFCHTFADEMPNFVGYAEYENGSSHRKLYEDEGSMAEIYEFCWGSHLEDEEEEV